MPDDHAVNGGTLHGTPACTPDSYRAFAVGTTIRRSRIFAVTLAVLNRRDRRWAKGTFL
jgi:hypothetical protein